MRHDGGEIKVMRHDGGEIKVMRWDEANVLVDDFFIAYR